MFCIFCKRVFFSTKMTVLGAPLRHQQDKKIYLQEKNPWSRYECKHGTKTHTFTGSSATFNLFLHVWKC